MTHEFKIDPAAPTAPFDECPIRDHAACVREIVRDEIDAAVMKALAKVALALVVAAVVYSLNGEQKAVAA